MSVLALNSTVDVFVATYIFDALCRRRLRELDDRLDSGDTPEPASADVPTGVRAELEAIATLWVGSHNEVPLEFVGPLLDELLEAWLMLDGSEPS